MAEPTLRRQERIRSVLSRRQTDLTLVMDNIHDPHNVSAILRSCDAFGVHRVILYYTTETFPELGRKSSASALKWVEQDKYSDCQMLVDKLKAQQFQITAAGFSPEAEILPRWDLTRPTAVILSNEHRGISPELKPYLDKEIYIPMQGMIKSLNVSVAAGIILYECWRQRSPLGMYEHSSFDPETIEEIFQNWRQK